MTEKEHAGRDAKLAGELQMAQKHLATVHAATEAAALIRDKWVQYAQDYGWTIQQTADALDVSRSTVVKACRRELL